jgi:hypothetical protein
MQFYIIHNDPKKNASLLPDYALKKVNIREGWQILSDIGHKFNVTWGGQYAKYNPYHVLTKSFWVNKESFVSFLSHYEYCLMEYTKRFNKTTVWHRLFEIHYSTINYLKNVIPERFSILDQNLEYLLTEKKKFLTEEDIQRIKGEDV